MGKHSRVPAWRTRRRTIQYAVAAGVTAAVAVAGTVALAGTSTPGVKSYVVEPASARVEAAVRPAAARASASASRDSRAAAEGSAAAARVAEPVPDRSVLREAAAEARQRVAARAEAAKAKAQREKAQRKKKAAQRAAAARSRDTASRSSRRLSGAAATVVAVAAQQQGDSYARGGAGPDTFDCSGLTQYVFAKVGITLPHSSAAQRAVARQISASELRPGDLVFVHDGGGGRVSHVAIYGGPGVWYEAQMYGRPVGAHAPWSSNVSYGRVL